MSHTSQKCMNMTTLVTILAATGEVQRELRANGILVQRMDEIDPVFTILPASSLAEIHSRCAKAYHILHNAFDN